MKVIQNPERINSWYLGDLTLLPVHPPKVDSFIFERMMDCFEVGVEEFAIRRVEYDWLSYLSNEPYDNVIAIAEMSKKAEVGSEHLSCHETVLTSLVLGSRSRALQIRS